MPGLKARILRGVAGRYLLYRAEDHFKGIAVPRGIFRKKGERPLPGDLVRYEPSGDPDVPWVICDILPRKNILLRPPLANLDLLLLTASAVLPETDYILIDRLIAYALKLGIEPVLLLTKTDLPGSEEQIARFTANYEPAGLAIFYEGFGDESALASLKAYISGHTAAFSGQSGAGKSSLLNRLMDKDLMDTGELSEKAGRGRQTTRTVEFFPAGDAFLADTPGFQNLDPQSLGLGGEALMAGYPELAPILGRCRFNDCRHLGETGCAVDQVVIHEERLERYRFMRRQIDDALKRY